MSGVAVLIVMITFGLLGLVFWNRHRVKGKVLCFFNREDKSLLVCLCEVVDSWILFQNRAYDIFPEMVRLTKFPMGWPAFLQELVPCVLYDEEDAVPLDWIHMGNRQERAMELRAALDENWMRKLVEETAREGTPGFNFKKIIPYAVLGIGVIGLIFILLMNFSGGY